MDSTRPRRPGRGVKPAGLNRLAESELPPRSRQNRSAFADPVAKQPVPRMSKSLTSEFAIAPTVVFTSDGFDFASKLLKDRCLPRIYSAAEPALSDSWQGVDPVCPTEPPAAPNLLCRPQVVAVSEGLGFA